MYVPCILLLPCKTIYFFCHISRYCYFLTMFLICWCGRHRWNESTTCNFNNTEIINLLGMDIISPLFLLCSPKTEEGLKLFQSFQLEFRDSPNFARYYPATDENDAVLPSSN